MTDATIVEPSVPEALTSEPVSTPDTEAVISDVSTSESTGSLPVPADPDDEAPRKNRAQERIEDLVAERNAAKEYADYWRERALEVMNQGKQAPQALPEPEVPQVPDLAPTLEQFNYDQKAWSAALSDWSRQTARTEYAKQQEQNAAQQAKASLENAFQERVDVFKTDHPDFDIVMANPKLPRLDQTAVFMIINSEHGAAISYELGKNPDLATRISRMSAAQQALAIGRLENKVTQPVTPRPTTTAPATPRPAATTVTKAPEPPTPVPAGGTPQATPDNVGVKEWMRNRVGEVRNRRRGY
jgi:hypothetical protein